MTKKASTRILGGTLLFTGLFIVSLLAKTWFWPVPANDDHYVLTVANITRIEGGRISSFPRVYEGEYIYYSFTLPVNQHYEGKFFRRQFSWHDYQVGQRIEVYYLKGKPSLNHAAHTERVLSQYWLLLPLLVATCLLVIGSILLITGRDFIQEWKLQREIAARNRAFAAV